MTVYVYALLGTAAVLYNPTQNNNGVGRLQWVTSASSGGAIAATLSIQLCLEVAPAPRPHTCATVADYKLAPERRTGRWLWYKAVAQAHSTGSACGVCTSPCPCAARVAPVRSRGNRFDCWPGVAASIPATDPGNRPPFDLLPPALCSWC